MSDGNRHVCTMCGNPITDAEWKKVAHKNMDKKSTENYHDEIHMGDCWKRYLTKCIEVEFNGKVVSC